MEQAIWIFSDDKKEMQIFDFFFDCDETTKGEGGLVLIRLSWLLLVAASFSLVFWPCEAYCFLSSKKITIQIQ